MSADKRPLWERGTLHLYPRKETAPAAKPPEQKPADNAVDARAEKARRLWPSTGGGSPREPAK